MPVEITMPQLSDTMTEGTLVKWLKKEGDKVKANEVIAEVETDKATMEMESFEGGTLAHIAAPEGTKVAVGQTIAFLAGKNEKVEDVKKTVGRATGAGGASGATGASGAKEPPAVSRTNDAASAAGAAAGAGASAHSSKGATATLTAPPERAKVGDSVDQGTASFRGASMGEMHEPDAVQAHGATREDINTAP